MKKKDEVFSMLDIAIEVMDGQPPGSASQVCAALIVATLGWVIDKNPIPPLPRNLKIVDELKSNPTPPSPTGAPI